MKDTIYVFFLYMSLRLSSLMASSQECGYSVFISCKFLMFMIIFLYAIFQDMRTEDSRCPSINETTELRYLSINENTELGYLSINENTELRYLSINENTELRYLSINKTTELKYLSISENTELRYLSFKENTGLKVSIYRWNILVYRRVELPLGAPTTNTRASATSIKRLLSKSTELEACSSL